MQRRSLGDNPWIFLNPSYANLFLIALVTVVFITDVIVISIHWNISTCSDILKLWIIGKYLAPLLSYVSCCCFMPCNFEETIDFVSSIPYSQYQSAQRRIRQNLSSFNVLSQIRSDNETVVDTNASQSSSSSTSDEFDCYGVPYPYDVLLSEWFVSPSMTTTNIAEYVDNAWSKAYIYTIGVAFDRGTLEMVWLFIGGSCIVSQDEMCVNHTPVLYYYVLLQIALGAMLTAISMLWILSTTLCPLQVARLMACCFGMECDVLGLLPRHLFQGLLTMHNQWNPRNAQSINSNKHLHRNRYHTLSTVPNHYEYVQANADTIMTEEEDVELMASTKTQNKDGRRTCSMCGHTFESECCPQCPLQNKQQPNAHGIVYDLDDSDQIQ